MKAAGRRPTRTWLWLGATAITIIVLSARFALYVEQKSFLALQHTYELMIHTDELRSTLTSAETWAIAYVSTGDRAYLNGFEAAREASRTPMDKLHALVQKGAPQEDHLERLKPLMQQKLEDLSSLISTHGSPGLEAARSRIFGPRGKQLMEEIVQIIGKMEDEERSTLVRYLEVRQSRLAAGLTALFVSTLSAIGCLLIGELILSRSIFRRQKAEEELQASVKRFEILCEQAPIGICQTDADGQCVYTNPWWSAKSGFSAAESLGRGWANAVHTDDRTDVFAKWKASGEQQTPWEYRLAAKQGEVRWIRALCGPIYSARGDLTGYVGTLEDVTEAKQADRDLREREALNRAILNSLPANIAVLTGEGRLLAINDSWQDFARVHGNPQSSPVDTGTNYLMVCKRAAESGSRDAQKAFAGIQGVLSGKRTYFEMQYPCHSTSEKRWFHMLVRPLLGVADGGAVVAHVDITRVKQAEEWFRRVFEAAPSGMVMSDRAGRITLVNARAEKLFGYESRELLGSRIESLVPEARRQIHAEDGSEFLNQPAAPMVGIQRELQARRKDGTQFPVEVGLIPFETNEGPFVLSSIMDITARKRAEEERQKFVSLADRTLEFVGMCDLDFKPFYVNDAGMRLVGLDNLEAACQVKFQDYFFSEDQALVMNEFFPRVLREGHGEVEIRFRHFKTGEAIWMLYNVFGIFDSRSNLVGWATVSVDITQRKRAEHKLQESRQELRALAGRLINAEEEERKRISRELHDDLSQKLALLAFDTGSLLEVPAPSADAIAEELRNLQARVVRLSQDVRQISHQLHPSILEDLGLAAALNELCEEFSAREGIEVLFGKGSAPETLPVAVASCLYRVAQEALHNVKKHARASQVRVKLSGSAECVRLSIHDTGIGFRPADGSRRQGLGIVSMQERVRLVQGEFSIRSEPGAGTEISVSVPLGKDSL